MNKSFWLVTVGTAGLTAALVFAYLAGGPEIKDAPEKAVTQKEAPAHETKPNSAPQPKPQVIQKKPLSPEQQAAAITQGELISSLFDAGSEGTPAGIESVYAALAHPDAEVREAAVDVIIQYIGKDGIPRLRAAMTAAESPEEKKMMAEAIEFVELPSISDGKARTPASQTKPSQGQKQKQNRPGFKSKNPTSDQN